MLLLGFGLRALGFGQTQYNLLKNTSANFNPAEYAQSALVSGIKWMFVLIPVVLLSVCLIFAMRNRVNKRTFNAVLRGIDAFREEGELASLTQQEREDIRFVTGEREEELWGGTERG